MEVLDWRNKKQLISYVEKYANHVLNNELLEQISLKNTSNCWPDDMSWLPNPEIFESFKNAFIAYYTHIKCFHATRPQNVNSYYEKGFLGQNQTEIEQQFRAIFFDVDANSLNKAIDDLNKRGEGERGKVFFVCDEREIIEDSGHYLIQGSEYLMALATKLYIYENHQKDYRLRLREIGTPTIFEADIPLQEIPKYQLIDLVQTIIALWGNAKLFPEEYCDFEMNFAFYRNISPATIVRHWHPSKIRDPHYKGWYHNKNIKCEKCML